MIMNEEMNTEDPAEMLVTLDQNIVVDENVLAGMYKYTVKFVEIL